MLGRGNPCLAFGQGGLRSAMGHGLGATTMGLRLGRRRGLQAVRVLDCLRTVPGVGLVRHLANTHRLLRAGIGLNPPGYPA